ncbi:MAG TPA: hypothetical protein PLO08_02980 [Alicycliphilus sp.]|nr:hypothetical protein [Alicycliphilus sp.]
MPGCPAAGLRGGGRDGNGRAARQQATAVSITASAVGLAADAAVGTAKLAGKGVGMTVDALRDEAPRDDASGVEIR